LLECCGEAVDTAQHLLFGPLRAILRPGPSQVFSLTLPTEDGDDLSVDLFVQQGDVPTDAFL
jgi:hypothetical protein